MSFPSFSHTSFLNGAFSSSHWNDHNPYFTSPNSKSSFVVIGAFRDTGNHHVIIYSLANTIKLHIKNTSDLKYFKVLIKTLFTFFFYKVLLKYKGDRESFWQTWEGGRKSSLKPYLLEKKFLIEKCISNKDWILVLGIGSDCLESVFKKCKLCPVFLCNLL